MRSNLNIIETTPFPAFSSVVSGSAWDDKYYVSEISADQAALRSISTDTSTVARRLWGEDQKQFTIISGTAVTCTGITLNAPELSVVYTEVVNSGIPITTARYPNFVVTSQPISGTLLEIGTSVGSLAVSTPVGGSVETLFGGVNSDRFGGYYGAIVANSASRSSIRSRTAERFCRELKQIVRVEPVIDGYDHPAEGFLREAFKREPDVARQWFLSAADEKLPPSLVADSLRLLGRITPADNEWRARIAAEGLRSSSAEVRDAAMQAIESWADPVLVSILMDHRQREPKKWLRDYADQIIQDLTE